MNALTLWIRPPDGRPRSAIIGAAAVAVLLAAGGCGDSPTATAPTKTDSQVSSEKPTTAPAAAAPAMPLAPLAADLTLTGAINGHATAAREGKDVFGSCSAGSIRVGISVGGHDYTVSATTFGAPLGDKKVPDEAVVVISDEVLKNNVSYMGKLGTVTFKSPKSAKFEVDLDGYTVEGKVHLTGTASCT